MESIEKQFIAECADFLADSTVTIKMGRDNPDIDFACLHFYVTHNGENQMIGTVPFVGYISDDYSNDDDF